MIAPSTTFSNGAGRDSLVLSDGVVRGFVLGTNEVDGGVTGFHDLLADNRFLS